MRKKLNLKWLFLALVAVIGFAGFVVASYPHLLEFPKNKSISEIPTPKRIIQVSSIGGLSEAISNAQAGDEISIKTGRYVTTEPLEISVKGTPAHPVLISAETLGGVELEGAYGLRINGSQNLIFRGLNFVHSQNGGGPSNYCYDCINVRFTSNVFALKNENDLASDWLSIEGRSNGVRVDHNTFRDKSSPGAFLALGGYEWGIVQNTIVDNNVFRSQIYEARSDGECLRVGSKGLAAFSTNSIIEHNVFESCIGAPEALVIESSMNTIRYNSFRDNYGSIGLREGNRNLVDGNTITGGHDGIRVWGSDHLISNNYLAELEGNATMIGATLVNESGMSTNESIQTSNIVIAHNTVFHNAGNIVVGSLDGNTIPTNVTIANNIVSGDTGRLVQVLKAEVSFANNIVHTVGSATVGDIPSAGYVNIDPQLEENGERMSPSEHSPAVDTIAESEAYGITKDIDGEARTGLFDIGADEF